MRGGGMMGPGMMGGSMMEPGMGRSMMGPGGGQGECHGAARETQGPGVVRGRRPGA